MQSQLAQLLLLLLLLLLLDQTVSSDAYQLKSATSMLLSLEAFHIWPAKFFREPGIQAVSRAA
jgi:hypothetical protein